MITTSTLPQGRFLHGVNKGSVNSVICDGRFALAIATFLPGIDQVLSQADTGMRASDGDLSVSWALHRIGNLDLSPWHLTNLIDLCALTANDAANELRKNKKTFKNMSIPSQLN